MRMIIYLVLSLLTLLAALVIIPAEYFNLVIYLVLMTLGILWLFLSYYDYKKVKRGKTCQGRLIDYENEYPNDWVDTVYRLRIEFDNPNDGVTYTVSGRQKEKPRKKDKYLVLVNEQDPGKSVLVAQVGISRLFHYAILIVVAGILAWNELR